MRGGFRGLRHPGLMGWAELYSEARRTHGAFAIHRAPEVGLTARAVQARAARESWRRPHPGVIHLPGSQWDHRAQLAAAQQHLSRRAAAGGQSAAWLFGIVPRPPSRPHLLLPHAQRASSAGLIVRRSRHVEPPDRMLMDSVSVLTPAFWSISMSATMRQGSLLAALIDLRQRRQLDLEDIWRRLQELPFVPGRRRLIRLLVQLDGDGSDSVFELRVRRRLDSVGLKPAPAPLPVIASNGRTVHLDIGFECERVAIECLGFIAHSSRSQLNRDAQRENTIALAGDWLILKLTWDRFLHDWDGFERELRAALAARG